MRQICYAAEEGDQLAARIEFGTVPRGESQRVHVLGRYTADQQASPADLLELLGRQKKHGITADWTVCAFGRPETECLLNAVSLGGKVRVGFENSLYNADGSLALSNSERVRKIRSLVQAK